MINMTIDDNKMLKAIEDLAMIEGINPNEVSDHEDLITELKKDFPDITEEKINELVENQKKKPDKRSKKAKPEEKIIGSEVITVHNGKEMIRDLNPKESSFQKGMDKVEDETNDAQYVKSVFTTKKHWDDVIDRLTPLITPSHISMIEHKSEKAKEKVTPYLNSLIAYDLISMASNLEVIVKTEFIPVPKLEDVMVVCVCTIRDLYRNTLVDGIVATRYLFKKRVLDEEDGEAQLDFGERGTVETCNTVAVRRAINYVVPAWVIKELTKIGLKKIEEQNRIRDGKPNEIEDTKSETDEKSEKKGKSDKKKDENPPAFRRR